MESKSLLSTINNSCQNPVKFPLNPAMILNPAKSYSLSRPNVTKKICNSTVTITSLPSSLSPARVSSNSARPRVGNVHFKERCEELGVKVLRIVNANDPITKLPGFIFNETFSAWRSACYAHVGIELVLECLKTYEDEKNEISTISIDKRVENGVNLMEFFKIDEILCVHDMQTYIEMIKNCPRRSRIRRKGVDLIKKLKETSMTTLALKYAAITWVVFLTMGCVTFSNMMR
ncbi:hypothetical protein L1987_86549 [Smallanthus sonchifolius]|uniref:Uncharacterized protein n=1 Tax=Smallanthus sonchifolius TaxID=185202 RepID=A0ACB8Y0D4_9ASTR|nr:hypothetical protein L1987_86549 [Smallanthus sonchifolius]